MSKGYKQIEPQDSKDTQFRPGKSGNPNGVPKGTKHLSTHIQKMLDDPKFEIKLRDGTLLKQRPVEAIIKTAIAKGISGDARWADWLAKYGYGTKQTIEHEGSMVIGTSSPEKAKKFAEFLQDETKD